MLSLSIGLFQNVAAQSGGGSAFTPASVSGIDFWLEADPTKLYTDAGTTLVSADGQAVQQANDKSSAARNVIQNTLANRPLYKTDLTKPSLLFNSSSNFLESTGSLSWTDGTGQYWIALSVQFNSHTATQQPVWLNGSALIGDIFTSGTDVGIESRNTVGTITFDGTGTAIFTDGVPLVVIGTVTSSAVEIFINNTSDGPTTLSGTRETSTGVIAIGSGAGTNPLNGRIFGVCHGTGTLSSADRASLQTYMAALHP